MTDRPRLIEVAFPLREASLDSVHEKNVRHGHISTLHIWPARRPLAACRAALIATLLPDPGDADQRKELLERIGGKIVKKIERKKLHGKYVEIEKDETVGGVLHWGRENSPDMDWFRAEIRKAYGGRAPRVLDPFAGGGAIPVEAMRLGCEATAIDINPVAWFILKCTLEYPQKLAGQKFPLPDFILEDQEFMTAFFEAQGFKGALLRTQLEKLGLGEKNPVQPDLIRHAIEDHTLEADLAWHVRAWGKWILKHARKDLARFYPVYADFEPLPPKGKKPGIHPEDWKDPRRNIRLVPLTDDGGPDIDALNHELLAGEVFKKDKKFKTDAAYRAQKTSEYLDDRRNPRWIAKPTVAYLWARTVRCKNCRATIPLLKTRWLSRKANKRTILVMEPRLDKMGVVFSVEARVPEAGGNSAQKREHDRRIAAGTMTRSGVSCPCCPAIMKMDEIQMEGKSGRLGLVLTAVMIDTEDGRAYRIPTPLELDVANQSEAQLDELFAQLPHGRINEPLAPASTRSISCDLYGIDNFSKAFTSRQQLVIGTLIKRTREIRAIWNKAKLPEAWRSSLFDYLAIAIDRVVDRCSVFCRPDPTPTQSGVINTFSRFALPMTWDFIEGVPLADTSGGYGNALDWIALVIDHCAVAQASSPGGRALKVSAAEVELTDRYDVVVTDPPYYQAISYADLSDLFYVWQRRLHDSTEFADELSPKAKEIVQHVRSDKDRNSERQKYHEGMYLAFCKIRAALSDEGRFVIVFAHKDPLAWESLVGAILRAGFIVDASWPIQTEMTNRGRALSTASLASSIWLICKKRPAAARPGWDNKVLDEMRERIHARLRQYWDAGIRGPNFVWAATGPAMEAYSKHPVVKKANDPGKVMEVGEFLRHVRRIVVDFVVGRVLSHGGEPTQEVSGLDDVTTYYLLHRHDFGTEDAPIGPCILYAVSCGLSDSDLADQYDLLVRTGGQASDDEDDATEETSEDAIEEEGTGSKVKLKSWQHRNRPGMGYDPSVDSPRARRAAAEMKLFEGVDPVIKTREVPMIDKVHRLMHLWKAGDVVKVDEYIDMKALRKHALFVQILQALIELSAQGSEERSILESISNHLVARGVVPEKRQTEMFVATQSEE